MAWLIQITILFCIQMERWNMDVHPPLFYIVLHTICSCFSGSFSKWFGIIPNIFYYGITTILGHRICISAQLYDCRKQAEFPETCSNSARDVFGLFHAVLFCNYRRFSVIRVYCMVDVQQVLEAVAFYIVTMLASLGLVWIIFLDSSVRFWEQIPVGEQRRIKICRTYLGSAEKSPVT